MQALLLNQTPALAVAMQYNRLSCRDAPHLSYFSPHTPHCSLYPNHHLLLLVPGIDQVGSRLRILVPVTSQPLLCSPLDRPRGPSWQASLHFGITFSERPFLSVNLRLGSMLYIARISNIFQVQSMHLYIYLVNEWMIFKNLSGLMLSVMKSYIESQACETNKQTNKQKTLELKWYFWCSKHPQRSYLPYSKQITIMRKYYEWKDKGGNILKNESK